MGNSTSKTINLPKGVENPGCLRDMYRKHGPDCVEEHVISNWNRWTEGKFPLEGTLSVDRLMVCRAIMEKKVKPFHPHLFGKWEKEARDREAKKNESRDRRDRKLCVTERDAKVVQRITDLSAEVYVQRREQEPSAPRRPKPPNYDDTWAPVYPPLPPLPPPVQPVPQPAPQPQVVRVTLLLGARLHQMNCYEQRGQLGGVCKGKGKGRGGTGGEGTNRWDASNQCWNCGQMGHFAHSCKTKQAQNGGRPTQQQKFHRPVWSQHDKTD